MLATKFGTIPAQSAVWLQGWTYGKEINIPADSIDADLSYFPLPVYLRDSSPANFDFSKCKGDGSDIRFTDAALNLLKFERKQHGLVTYTEDLCSGGDAIASNEYASADLAFNNKTSDYWRTSTGGAGIWIGYNFTSAKAIRRIIYNNSGSTTYSANSVAIDYSDDGTTWTEVGTYTTSTTSEAVNTLDVPATVGSHAYWRLRQISTTNWRVAEIQMLEAATNFAVYNVQVPTVTNLSDTKIYMWWGKADAYNASIEAWQDQTGKALTYNGNVKIVRNSATDHYASFDGSGDYLTAADSEDWNFGSGEFCIEAFFKRSAIDEDRYLFGQGSGTAAGSVSIYAAFDRTGNDLKARATDGTSWFEAGKAAFTDTASYHHLALLRSGNSFKMYLDGVAFGSVGDLTGKTIRNDASVFGIGSLGSYTTTPFNGNIKGVRITKGRARYTANFTPPTSFEIDGTDVVLCTNFDTIYDSNYVMVQHLGDTLTDASGNNNSGTAIGTTVVDTDYGKIRQFNGTSDYVSCPSAAAITGDNPYTIVALADNTTGNAYSQNIIGWGDGATANKNTCMQVVNGTYKLRTSWWAPDLDAATTLTLGTYYALAIKYDQTTRKNLVNGVVDGTDTPADHAAVTTRNYIGCVPKTTRDSYWYGYIGEVRVSNIARSDAWIKAESLALKNSLITMTDLD